MVTSKDFYDLAKTWADSGMGNIDIPSAGYQCIALISGLNRDLGAGLTTYVRGDAAKNFYIDYASGALSTPGWHTVAGNPRDDADSARIYNSLPKGAICCWETTGSYSWAGHISIKAGNWGEDYDTIEQNGATPNKPAHYANMGKLCAGGWAGFLGAVVSDDDGWGGSSPSGSTQSSPQPGSGKPGTDIKIDLMKTLNEFMNKIKDMFNQNVYTASDKYMFNKVVKLTRNMNLWRVRLSDEALDEIKNELEKALKSLLKSSQGSVATDTPQGAPTSNPSIDEDNMSDEDKVRYITKMCLANCGNANAYGIAGLVGNFVGESGIDPFTFEAKTYWRDGGEDWRNDPTVETLFGSWSSFLSLYAIPLNEEAYKGSDARHYCGLGLGQWTGPRGEGLANYGRENGKGWYSLQTQMEYAFKEGATTETLKKCLANSESVREGVDNVYQFWERANVPDSLPTRYGGGEQWYPFIKNIVDGN
ncbi:PlyCA [Streptococcus phage vB_SbRt-pBovineB21]|nr:PlyCA [Streptococcus phage vB_SbRt-pBovineB21]